MAESSPRQPKLVSMWLWCIGVARDCIYDRLLSVNSELQLSINSRRYGVVELYEGAMRLQSCLFRVM